MTGMTVGLLASAQVALAQQSVPAQWTKYENLQALTLNGRTYTPTCSGFPGTDPKFSFWAKRGTSKNLVVYFEGGGACWDNTTCSFPIGSGLPAPAPQFFVPAIPAGASPANLDGIFKLDNPANPVRDWSFVYIPYCTGDIHLGSADVTITNAGPLLPPGATFTIKHRGFDNFIVVLDWIKKSFGRPGDRPAQVLVTGISAGGYGASANFPYIQEAFPQSRMFVIADASQGVTTPGFNAWNPGAESWNPQLAPWVYGESSVLPGADLLRIAAEAYPRAKVSQFTTNLDTVQIGFYSYQKSFYGPGGSCPVPAPDWNQQMLATLGAYASQVDNFRYYLAEGTYHTIMSSSRFYVEKSPGIVFRDWVAGMLKSQGGTGGNGGLPWADVACPTCLTPLPCVSP
jgi:hypothetical protein